MTRPRTYEWFIKKFNENNKNNIEIIGDYKNMSTKLLVKCNRCGKEWMAHPQKLVKGYNCRECAYKDRNKKHKGNNRKKTQDEFVTEIGIKKPNIKIIGEYVNARTKIKCECTLCGNIWDSVPRNLLSIGNGCPECGNRNSSSSQRKSHDEFISQMTSINSNITILETYKNQTSKISCLCNVCGSTWMAMPSNLLRGEGCPYHSISKGELQIARFLDSNNIEYNRQMRFPDLVGVGGGKLSYDFYVPSVNALIEYQGEFHDGTAKIQNDTGYKKQITHDSMKKRYAESHGFLFKEIWYYDNIEEKLNEIINPVTTTAQW